MTPEQLAEMDIAEDSVRVIQDSVNTYYAQFEQAEAASAEAVEAAVEEPAEAPVEEFVEEAAAEAAGEEIATPHAEADTEQSGTIEDAGSPHSPSEGAVSREHPEE